MGETVENSNSSGCEWKAFFGVEPLVVECIGEFKEEEGAGEDCAGSLATFSKVNTDFGDDLETLLSLKPPFCMSERKSPSPAGDT